MEIAVQNSDIRLADLSDKEIILNILTESFKSDPHIQWLLGKSCNKNKLHIIMEYLIEETFSKGKIFLTNNNLGVALWQSENKDKFSMELIKRNLRFLFKLGIASVVRNLKFLKISHSHYQNHKKFYYLLTLGVLEEGRGKGLASQLMNPILEYCRDNNIPVFLETANPTNIEIYKKKGFAVTDSLVTDNVRISFMRNES